MAWSNDIQFQPKKVCDLPVSSFSRVSRAFGGFMCSKGGPEVSAICVSTCDSADTNNSFLAVACDFTGVFLLISFISMSCFWGCFFFCKLLQTCAVVKNHHRLEHSQQIHCQSNGVWDRNGVPSEWPSSFSGFLQYYFSRRLCREREDGYEIPCRC